MHQQVPCCCEFLFGVSCYSPTIFLYIVLNNIDHEAVIEDMIQILAHSQRRKASLVAIAAAMSLDEPSGTNEEIALHIKTTPIKPFPAKKNYFVTKTKSTLLLVVLSCGEGVEEGVEMRAHEYTKQGHWYISSDASMLGNE